MATLTQEGFSIDYDYLARLVQEKHQDFVSAQPFPHVVIDGFLPERYIQQVLNEFPPPDAPLEWRKHYVQVGDGSVAQANKLGFSDETKLGPTLRQLLWELNSAKVLKAFEGLTGIENLIGDPHYVGGGIHQSLPGAVLAVHADFNTHPTFQLNRRLNLILFLNPEWHDEWGGHLELWSKDMKTCLKRVAPVMNRAVIFQTLVDSYHGHPHPLKCPEGMTRKSVALYYYTNGRPQSENVGEHGTLWQALPTAPKSKGLFSWFQK